MVLSPTTTSVVFMRMLLKFSWTFASYSNDTTADLFDSSSWLLEFCTRKCRYFPTTGQKARTFPFPLLIWTLNWLPCSWSFMSTPSVSYKFTKISDRDRCSNNFTELWRSFWPFARLNCGFVYIVLWATKPIVQFFSYHNSSCRQALENWLNVVCAQEHFLPDRN